MKVANDYYKNNKEKLSEKTRNKYRSLFEEEQNIRRKYRRNRYHNMSKEKKTTTKVKRISKKLS